MDVAGVDSSADEHATMDLLELRLRRVEFLLSGSSNVDGLPNKVIKPENVDSTVTNRIQAMQERLQKLQRTQGVVGELIREINTLHAKYPELRRDPPSIPAQDLSMQASVVLANATLFPETASRLSSLQTLQVPSMESSTTLTTLRADLGRYDRLKELLDGEVHELRHRSARCLEWWIKTGVVGMGDLWEEWEHRILELERQVGRLDRQYQAQEGYI